MIFSASLRLPKIELLIVVQHWVWSVQLQLVDSSYAFPFERFSFAAMLCQAKGHGFTAEMFKLHSRALWSGNLAAPARRSNTP